MTHASISVVLRNSSETVAHPLGPRSGCGIHSEHNSPAERELAGGIYAEGKERILLQEKKKRKKNPVLHSQSHVHKYSPGLEAVSAITGIPASALFSPRALQNLKASQEHV